MSLRPGGAPITPPARRWPAVTNLALTLLLALAAPAARPALADDPAAGESTAAIEPVPEADTAALKAPDIISTSHSVALARGGRLAYTAQAGMLPVQPADQPLAGVFYVAYTRDSPATRRRPVTFLFNGGPGAASVFLHLGGIGPRRLSLNADGSWPPAPVGLVENPLTWLAFTDLVFIDPVGTGYSYVPDAAPEGEKEPSKRAEDSDFWGVERDLDSLGEFIRLYLTRNDRWLSPKLVAGESYGGFRVAALAQSLTDDFDIALNGAILVSPVMDYAMLGGNRYNLLPWALTLPSLAATAAWHERGSLAATSAGQDLGTALAPVERFALSDMLVGLAGTDAAAVHAAIAAFSGLPEAFVARRRGRVEIEAFAKELLRAQERLVGRYDGTISGPDPHPDEADYEGGDPSFAVLNSFFAPAVVAYLQGELDYRTDAVYRLVNRDVGREWDFSGALAQRRQGFAGFSEALRLGLILNPALKVLITHGYHDLITPYLASRYLVEQMDLPADAAARLRLANFIGGHMFYLRRSSLEALHATAAQFFADLDS
jgi:carboxypeptidase C (cathepsin A)